jgi:dTDP-4-dehydrorhamnose reductase
MEQKTIVFGNGFLGTRISEELGYKLVGRDEVDLSDFSSLKKYIDSEKPDVIINAVVKLGKPNADWCENNHGVTLESNVLVPSNFARICEEKSIYLVNMSSGCIYNGDNNGKGFLESDKPNYYGVSFHLTTKILGEKILEGFPGLIVRLKMPIDVKPHPRNLITKLAGYSSVIDEQNSMTTVPHLIKTMEKLINKRAIGTYNVFHPGTISATEIMNMYKEIVDPNHSFKTIPLDELKTVARRSNSYLNTDKLRAEGIFLPEIHDAVRECLEKYANNIK